MSLSVTSKTSYSFNQSYNRNYSLRRTWPHPIRHPIYPLRLKYVQNMPHLLDAYCRTYRSYSHFHATGDTWDDVWWCYEVHTITTNFLFRHWCILVMHPRHIFKLPDEKRLILFTVSTVRKKKCSVWFGDIVALMLYYECVKTKIQKNAYFGMKQTIKYVHNLCFSHFLPELNP